MNLQQLYCQWVGPFIACTITLVYYSISNPVVLFNASFIPFLVCFSCYWLLGLSFTVSAMLGVAGFVLYWYMVCVCIYRAMKTMYGNGIRQ